MRQGCHPKGVGERDGEKLDPVQANLLGDEGVDRSGELKLADGNLDGDLLHARDR
jgi:hypothetical protein